MDSHSSHSLVGIGVYSLAEAARLAGVPPRSLRRWLFGYSYKYKDQTRSQSAVFHPSRATEADDVPTITFQDLIEIRFVHAFRQVGVSWHVIRLAAEKAQQRFQNDHPFSTDAFATDGRRIFEQLREEGVREKKVVDLISDQYCFRAVVMPSFRAQIDLTSKGAQRWWPLGKSKQVVIDPARQFGQPIVNESAVPTSVLAKAVDATGSEREVAKWYEVGLASVRQAVIYERQLAA